MVTGSDATHRRRRSARRPRARLVAEVAGRVGSTAGGHLDRRARRRPPDGRSGRCPAVALALADRRAAGEPLQYVLGTLAFRSAGAAGRPPGPHPAARDRAGGRGGPGRAGPRRSARDRRGPRRPVGLRRPGDRLGRHRPVAGRRRGRPGPTARGVGDRRVDRRPRRGPRQPGRAWPATDPAAAGRVTFVAGPWFAALPERLAGRVDLVVSNPPYVTEAEFADLDPTVRELGAHEALVAPPGPERRGRAGRRRGGDRPAPATWLRRQGGAGGGAGAGTGRRRPSTPPDGPGSPGSARPATWPVGCACWWRRDDPGGRGVRVRGACASAAEALADGAVVAVPTDTVYGLAVDPAQPERRGTPVRTQGPTGRRAAAGARRRGGAGGHGGRPSRVGRPAPGRSLLARTAHPGRAPSAGVRRGPRRTARGPSHGRRPPPRPSGDRGPVRAARPAGRHQRQPPRAPRRPPRPSRWCGPSPDRRSPDWWSTAARATGSPRRSSSAGARRPGACARGRWPGPTCMDGDVAGPARRRPLRRRAGLTVPVPTGDTWRMQHSEPFPRVDVIIID